MQTPRGDSSNLMNRIKQQVGLLSSLNIITKISAQSCYISSSILQSKETDPFLSPSQTFMTKLYLLELEQDRFRQQMKQKTEENSNLKQKIDQLTSQLRKVEFSGNRARTTQSKILSDDSSIHENFKETQNEFDGEQWLLEQSIARELYRFFEMVTYTQSLQKLCKGSMSTYKIAIGMLNSKNYLELFSQCLQSLNQVIEGLSRIRIDPLLISPTQSNKSEMQSFLSFNKYIEKQQEPVKSQQSPNFDVHTKDESISESMNMKNEQYFIENKKKTEKERNSAPIPITNNRITQHPTIYSKRNNKKVQLMPHLKHKKLSEGSFGSR